MPSSRQRFPSARNDSPQEIFCCSPKKFSYENNGFLKILDGRILVRVSAHFNFSLLLKKIYFSKKTSQELRMLSRSKNHKKRMFTKMLDVGRGGRYINNLKNSSQVKTFHFWKKYILFIDQRGTSWKHHKNCKSC